MNLDHILRQMPELTLAYLIRVISALLILYFGRLAVRWGINLFRDYLRRKKVDETLVSFFSNLAQSTLMVMVLIAALAQLGVQTTSLIALLGAAGLAVGLSLQGSLSNFAAGVLIVIFKPFRVGDAIEAGGVLGIVEEIGILTTELRSPDNRKIIVPNSKIMADSIVNYTAKPTRRLDLKVQVSYADDLQKARRVVEEILAGEPRVLKDPSPVIGVLELGDNGVTLAIRPWVNTTDYWPVMFALNERIKERFAQEGITIPFPQRVVHFADRKASAPPTD